MELPRRSVRAHLRELYFGEGVRSRRFRYGLILFDVLTIGDLTKRDLLTTLPKTFWGGHLPHPKAELLRGATVTVDAPEPLPIELDGEQPGTTPVRFELVRSALRVRVPA